MSSLMLYRLIFEVLVPESVRNFIIYFSVFNSIEIVNPTHGLRGLDIQKPIIVLSTLQATRNSKAGFYHIKIQISHKHYHYYINELITLTQHIKINTKKL